MGDAYQCDRCGSLNRGSPSVTVSRPTDKSSTKSKIERFTLLEDRDLCKSCTREFRDWWVDGGDEA